MIIFWISVTVILIAILRAVNCVGGGEPEPKPRVKRK